MLLYSVDLGTTNLKVALFDERLTRLAVAEENAVYTRRESRVEFDPDSTFEAVLRLIGRCALDSGRQTSLEEAIIVLTGQAESFVVIDDDGPLRPGISWLDERSKAESDEIREHFDPADAFATTGQPAVTATWPATKLRWLRHHEPEVLSRATRILMVKDYIQYRLTGRHVGEVTTRGFSYFFDVRAGDYWDPMLEFCGVTREQMPDLVAPGTDIGPVLDSVRAKLPNALSTHVNVGALDHFCSMVGTNSYRAQVVSESAGTVLSLSMLATDWSFEPQQLISFHAGLRPDEIILFNGADSGGVSLEWYKDRFLGDVSYELLQLELEGRTHRDAPLFLPYLTGVNPPEYFPDARAAFLGLTLEHDRIDLAFAVEEGVAHLLRHNIDAFTEGEPALRSIVSSGGGSRSSFWSQLKADVCQVEIHVPDEAEATCRGAAILALVARGMFADLDDAARFNEPPVTTYQPTDATYRAARFHDYLQAINALYRQ